MCGPLWDAGLTESNQKATSGASLHANDFRTAGTPATTKNSQSESLLFELSLESPCTQFHVFQFVLKE